jgi:hypothetical protein
VPSLPIFRDEESRDECDDRLEFLAHRHGAVNVPHEPLKLLTSRSRGGREHLAADLNLLRLYVVAAHVVPFAYSISTPILIRRSDGKTARTTKRAQGPPRRR